MASRLSRRIPVIFGGAGSAAGSTGGGAVGSTAPDVGANDPVPAVYALELIQPRAAGTAPGSGSDMPTNPTMPSGHRIFRAYPGIPYNIRAAVLGGSYPFTFALDSTALAAGMTINSSTGEINWPNPQTNLTPTITVTDAEGTVVSSPWTITVATTGFKFVDANASAGGSGTLASPWDSLADVFASSASSEIVYFRAGTYTPAGITRGSVGSDWERIELSTLRSAQWLAYPGESVYYDAGYTGSDPGALVRMTGTTTYPVYVDGIRFHNARNILLQLISEGLRYQTVRRSEFYDIRGGIDGGNPAGIMCVTDNSNVSPCYWSVFQDIDGYDLVNAGTVKMYGRFKCLMENVTNVDCSTGSDIAKDNMTRWEVRGCTITGSTLPTPQSGLYGSMNDPAYTGYPFNGEIRFNLVMTSAVDADTFLCHLNEFGRCHQIDVYRNTFVGAKVGAVQLNTYEDGPFRFYNNVIVNAESGDKITKWTGQYGGSVSTASNVIVGTAVGAGRLDNLTGVAADGIVDANGLLQGAYRSTYLGTHGHEVS